ncbi:MAG: Ig-like domain-containing protein [Chloroflexi bacterium]|nr:Ig-like domain-containing protein [Chloroflexota bacterium]
MHRRLVAAFAASAFILLAGMPPAATPGPVRAADGDPPENPCALVAAPAEPRHGDGIATLGTLEAVHADGRNLQVVQEGMKVRKGEGPGEPADGVEHHLPLGYPGNHLQVKVDDATVVCIGGVVSSMEGLEAIVGATVMVAGSIDGASVKATVVADLAEASPGQGAAAGVAAAGMRGAAEPAASRSLISAVSSGIVSAAAEIALCLGQDMDYDADTFVREFQGCFGGPSGTDSVDVWLPVTCVVVGCVMVDRITYTGAILGWAFDFPFAFEATGATPYYGTDSLTYHVPGTVTTRITPKPATDGEVTFSGGFGLNFGLGAEFCSIFGCYGMGTFNLNAYSMIHQATKAGPLTGQTMEIKEVACPNILSIGISDSIPFLNWAAVKLCEDLTFTGQPFYATVTATGASEIGKQRYGFEPDARTMTVTPDGIPVSVVYDDLLWKPLVDMALRFRISFLTGVWKWDVPWAIHIGTSTFDAICHPFPSCGVWMSYASDPSGAPGNTLHQPEAVPFSLSVAPAPTQLHIVSTHTIAEGQPVRATLTEDYSGAPVVGETVVFTATSAAGPMTISDTTDATGEAHAVFPIGEYAVTAAFTGTDYFEPASDAMTPVYVYRPTNFVIWGGDPGGFPAGARYTFWGSQWWKQVVSGAYAAGSSFKGWAESISGGSWQSPPADAAPRPPAVVPAYIGVVVTTDVRMRGSRAYGNVHDLAVLKVDDPAGYRPDPGHPATGVLKALIR